MSCLPPDWQTDSQYQKLVLGRFWGNQYFQEIATVTRHVIKPLVGSGVKTQILSFKMDKDKTYIKTRPKPSGRNRGARSQSCSISVTLFRHWRGSLAYWPSWHSLRECSFFVTDGGPNWPFRCSDLFQISYIVSCQKVLETNCKKIWSSLFLRQLEKVLIFRPKHTFFVTDGGATRTPQPPCTDKIHKIVLDCLP